MRITVLAGKGESTDILLNCLADNGYDDVEAIIEEPALRSKMIRYRMKRLGVLTTINQLIFMTTISPLLQRLSGARRSTILAEYGLRTSPPTPASLKNVPTINDASVLSALEARQPDIVLVNGTRIIRKKILNAVAAPYVNIHAGINPAYRGVHGGFWALWNKDPDNFGATIHLVDPGVDTGSVLSRQYAMPTAADNFATYPTLQQAICMKPLLTILERVSSGVSLQIDESETGQSNQWFHPTIWQYLAGYLRGVS